MNFFLSYQNSFSTQFSLATKLEYTPTWHFLDWGRVKSGFSVPDSPGFSVWQESSESQLVSLPTFLVVKYLWYCTVQEWDGRKNIVRCLVGTKAWRCNFPMKFPMKFHRKYHIIVKRKLSCGPYFIRKLHFQAFVEHPTLRGPALISAKIGGNSTGARYFSRGRDGEPVDHQTWPSSDPQKTNFEHKKR